MSSSATESTHNYFPENMKSHASCIAILCAALTVTLTAEPVNGRYITKKSMMVDGRTMNNVTAVMGCDGIQFVIPPNAIDSSLIVSIYKEEGTLTVKSGFPRDQIARLAVETKRFNGPVEIHVPLADPNKPPAAYAVDRSDEWEPLQLKGISADRTTAIFLTDKPVTVAIVDGAKSTRIEGEQLKIGKGTGGSVTEQPMQGFQGHWSNDRQLVWVTAKPGDTLELTMSVQEAGNYQVRAQFTKAPDYGIFDVLLDGKRAADGIDLYNIRVDVSGPVDLGVHKLQAGDHTLKFGIKGANPLAIKSYMFGLDYIDLTEQNNGPGGVGR